MSDIVEKARGEWQEWMRRPDNAEDFSLDDVCKWMNERPVGAFLLLADEIARLRAATQWRPIESAPKDVKQSYEALITGGTRFNTADCFGGGAGDEVDWTACAEWSVTHQRWQSDDCSSGYEEYWVYEPTHWQPLPPPPAMNQEGGV